MTVQFQFPIPWYMMTFKYNFHFVLCLVIVHCHTFGNLTTTTTTTTTITTINTTITAPAALAIRISSSPCYDYNTCMEAHLNNVEFKRILRYERCKIEKIPLANQRSNIITLIYCYHNKFVFSPLFILQVDIFHSYSKSRRDINNYLHEEGAEKTVRPCKCEVL